MTNERRAAIEEYRNDGYGYKKVSQLTGVCESTIKMFCRRNGLGWNAQENKAEGKRAADEKKCLCCRKPSSSTPTARRKFCSDVCRNRWWNSHLNLVKRKVVHDFVCPT